MGVIISSPVWLYQFWAFIAPGLYARERRWAYFFVGAAVPLFAFGGALAYFAMTKGLRFLLGLVPNHVIPLITINTYLSYAIAMLFIFGLAFELPLVVVLLNLAGILTHERFAKSQAADHLRGLRLRGHRHAEPRPHHDAAARGAVRGAGRAGRDIRLGQRPPPGAPAVAVRRAVAGRDVAARPGIRLPRRRRHRQAGTPRLAAPAGQRPARHGPRHAPPTLDHMSTPASPASPAERYAAARSRISRDGPELTAFQRLYDFTFDDFQLAACRALNAGHGVLLAAPTGSGKTVVGEFAVHLALAEGRKCFYTTPIKALSNQKYSDLVRRYGAGQVGLLTGDNSINGEAPIVVMTTEVLRNMLYAGSPTLTGLAYVVLDEVHYLADRFRGAVWEEVIIHLPESVRLVALSATVSNAEEFGDWLAQVRGGTTVIVDEHRPVPLWQHMMVGSRLYDLFTSASSGNGSRTSRGAAARTSIRNCTRIAQRDTWAPRKAPGRRPPPRTGRPDRGGRRGQVQVASRPQVISRLDAAGLLPAITFIFSRAGCDAAVLQCLAAGLRLTTTEEADEITALVAERTADIPADDLDILGYRDWLRRPAARDRRAPRRACCRRSRRSWRSCSRPGWCARCSLPRPSPSASTCPPGPWSSSGWTNGTGRPTPT